MIFYRADHTSLVIKLNSDEPLGILDTDYVEDYYGNDSQLTIYNTGTTDETVLSMVALPLETPLVSDDVFQGSVLLSSLPDGDYEIRGRVRDLIGNYTILTSFGSPAGGERVMPFLFSIEEGVFIPNLERTFKILDHNRGFIVNNAVRAYIMPDIKRLSLIDISSRGHLIVPKNRIYTV